MLFKNTTCKKNNLYAKKILLQKNFPQYVNREGTNEKKYIQTCIPINRKAKNPHHPFFRLCSADS